MNDGFTNLDVDSCTLLSLYESASWRTSCSAKSRTRSKLLLCSIYAVLYVLITMHEWQEGITICMYLINWTWTCTLAETLADFRALQRGLYTSEFHYIILLACVDAISRRHLSSSYRVYNITSPARRQRGNCLVSLCNSKSVNSIVVFDELTEWFTWSRESKWNRSS